MLNTLSRRDSEAGEPHIDQGYIVSFYNHNNNNLWTYELMNDDMNDDFGWKEDIQEGEDPNTGIQELTPY